MRTYHEDGTLPEGDDQWIWVFGSKLAGIHGAGAALVAYNKFEFPMYQNVGLRGRAYAIPTKDRDVRTPLSLSVIQNWVNHFIAFARLRIDSNKFFVTAIGCGYAGYTNAEIAPMFKGAPDNCSFPHTWREFLGD